MTQPQVEIDSALVGRLVASQFPDWACLPVRPVRTSGWDNRTFHLGEDMIVRLPSASSYAAQVAKEQKWLPQIAPLLPQKIPEPLAMGGPGEAYPWHWSVYRWIEGETAASAMAEGDPPRFGADLAGFLTALHRVDAAAGPPAGEHSFHRGGALAVYDEEAREAIRRLGGTPEARVSAAIWETALSSRWLHALVWVHGDLAPDNLILTDDRLTAVIDWGCSAVGDPACDLIIAWTHFIGAEREAFQAGLSVDGATWERARGWALWKALILATGLVEGPEAHIKRARFVLDQLLEDHASVGR